jgi:hypothetical protein
MAQPERCNWQQAFGAESTLACRLGSCTTIEYDCAQGTIEHGIALDSRGRFNVPGMQVPEQGGPVRQNEQLAGDPVRFSGQVKGQTMELTVRSSVT